MKPYIPDIITVDERSLDDEITGNILDKFPDIPYEIIKEGKKPGTQAVYAREVTKSKKILNLKYNPGKFIERCPGTREHLCCNYYVANLAVNCHFECTYCFLQSYLNDHTITVYTNIGDFFNEINELPSINSDRKLRIGTGELADSLALDELTGFSRYLVPFFGNRDDILLELKTKGDFINNLLAVDPNDSTVIAWSLNPQIIIDKEELKCSSLKERLDSAKECAEYGYKTAFHFDPVILYDGWREDYIDTIDMLFEHIPADNIQWISMGVLRFNSAGKTIIRTRFPKTNIIYEEMVKCRDGKYRYPQPVRTDLYKTLFERIRKYSDDSLYVYLCMESKAVWERVFGNKSNLIAGIKNF
ncbi:radical SAM protein [candidate division KSB1 bacterium]